MRWVVLLHFRGVAPEWELVSSNPSTTKVHGWILVEKSINPQLAQSFHVSVVNNFGYKHQANVNLLELVLSDINIKINKYYKTISKQPQSV